MKISYVFAALVVICIVFGCIDNQPGSTDSTDNVKSASELDADFEKYLIQYKQRKLFKDGVLGLNRSVYGISSIVFEDLPPVPDDFLFKIYLIKVGKFFDIDGLGPEYWKQPEFDPEFTRQGLKYWKNWDGSKKHWSTMGIRTYPYSQNVRAVPGDSFNVTLFISTDWSVETYQGIRLEPIWIETAISQTGDVVDSSVTDGDYINVNVTPNEFLLTPAFPKFTPEWIKKVKFTGKVDEDTPPGMYIMSVDITVPSKSQSDGWFLEYLNLYSEGVQMVKLDKPYLQVFVDVRDGEEEA